MNYNKYILLILLISFVLFCCFSCKRNLSSAEIPCYYLIISQIRDVTGENDKPVQLSSNVLNQILEQAIKKSVFFKISDCTGDRGEQNEDFFPFTLSSDILYNSIKNNESVPAEDSATGYCGVLMILKRQKKGEISEVYETKITNEKAFINANPDKKKEIFTNLITETIDKALHDLACQLKVSYSNDKEVIEMINSSNINLRKHSIQTAGERRLSDASEILRPLLKEENKDLLLKVIGAIGQIHDEKSIPYLAKLMGKQESEIVSSALYTIGDIGGEQAIKYLKLIKESDPVPAVREEANKILERLK